MLMKLNYFKSISTNLG